MLIGAAKNGADRKSDQFQRDGTELTRNERRDFRKMAAHPEVVEQVIQESTECQPAVQVRPDVAFHRGRQRPATARHNGSHPVRVGIALFVLCAAMAGLITWHNLDRPSPVIYGNTVGGATNGFTSTTSIAGR